MCRFEPNAALSCATTELMPAEKLMPIVVLFGFDGDVCCGSVVFGSSASTVIVCWTLPLSV